MKIDTAKIPGFDALPEEARTAILGMEFADAPDMSGYVAKEVFDKKAAETAELNRKLKAQMSEEEKTAAERDAKWAEMEAKLAELEREKLESGYRAEFLALGYDEALAAETAKALAEGDTAKVFANQKKAAEQAAKKMRDELLKGDPFPGGATGKAEPKTPGGEFAERYAQAAAKAASEHNRILEHYLK